MIFVNINGECETSIIWILNFPSGVHSNGPAEIFDVTRAVHGPELPPLFAAVQCQCTAV